jgi:Tol biopolymer transport system component
VQHPPIAFASSRSDHDLIVIQADGSHRRVVATSGQDETVPAWSPAGTRIAFSHFDGQRERVDVLDVRTGRVRDLGVGYNPDWSPDGTRLVFVDAESFGDLVTIDSDGTNRQNLNLTSSGIADETDPAWSPDGSRIAFMGDGLYTVHPDGTNLHRIRREGYGGSASWSPDSRRIAFDCAVRRFQVCTVLAGGSGLRHLSNRGRHPKWSPRANVLALTRGDTSYSIVLVRPNGSVTRTLPAAAEPDWSPNGKRLIAEREIGGGPRLYAVDPSGRSIARLTQGHRADAAPAWSPGGGRIALRRRIGRQCSLAVLDLGSQHVRRIVPRTADRFCRDRPDWSSDGKRIVFSSGSDLWLVAIEGGRPHRLTRTRVSETSPRWAPDHRSIGFLARTGIWLLRPNGTRSLLVRGGGYFAWSHDGQTLAYASYNNQTEQFDLYLRTGNAPSRRLYEGIDGAPTWSPEDRLLAFVHSDPDPHGASSLVVVDLEGSASDLGDETAGQPDWRS